MESIHILLIFFDSHVVVIQHAVDLEAVAAIDAQFGYDLEMLAHVQMEMGKEEGFRNGHLGFIGPGFGETVTRLPIPLELIAFIVHLGSDLHSHVGEDAEHGKVAHQRKAVNRILGLPKDIAVGVEKTILERCPSEYAKHPVVVGSGNIHLHAVQIGIGYGIRQGEELFIQIDLGPGKPAAAQKGCY